MDFFSRCVQNPYPPTTHYPTLPSFILSPRHVVLGGGPIFSLGLLRLVYFLELELFVSPLEPT